MQLGNDLITIHLDERWPRIVELVRRDTDGRLAGCDPAHPFVIEIDGTPHTPEPCTPRTVAERVLYDLHLPALGLIMTFAFAVDGEAVIWQLDGVEETGGYRLQNWRIPDHRLITGRAAHDDAYLRHGMRRRSWSGDWTPGSGCYDDWEDQGRVGDGPIEYGSRLCKHACVWNERVCAACDCSIRVAPLLTDLDSEGQVLPGRAGRFSIAAGVHAYRLRGTVAEPFRLTIGVLADYNGDGRIDWCDAAGWEGDRVFGRELPYRETIVYKLMVDNSHGDGLSFDDCLGVIRRIHAVSGGLPQIVYLVGWQYQGHDTGYPSFDTVNPALGGEAALRQLIAAAGDYGCIVSLHVNVDDSYAEHPGHDPSLLSRGPDGTPYPWFHVESRDRQVGYSISHTLDVERGNFQRRIDALLDRLPIRKTIHFDAHRPYNEVWTADGDYISAECEVQRGMVPIQDHLRARGIDMTTEDSDGEKRGLYRWVWHWPHWHHPYSVVMAHGRLAGRWWPGLQSADIPQRPEGQALGQCVVCSEMEADDHQAITRKFYCNWMYAQLLGRKKMTGYRIGDWRFGIAVTYKDATRTEAGSHYPPRPVHTVYEGIPIAAGTDRFLPWRDDTIYAYSCHGGAQEWLLPESWEHAAITCTTMHEHGETAGPPIQRNGRTIHFEAPAGVPLRLTRVG